MDYVNKTSGQRPRHYKQNNKPKTNKLNPLYIKYGAIAVACLTGLTAAIAFSLTNDDAQDITDKPLTALANEQVIAEMPANQGASVVASRQGDNFATNGAAKRLVNTSSKSNDEPLPELPKADFIYPDLLSKSKEIASNAYDVPDPTPYRLRCGAFRHYNDALRLANKIKPVFGMDITQSGQWYIVRSGYLDTKRDAQDMNNKVKRKARVFDCILQKQPKSR